MEEGEEPSAPATAADSTKSDTASDATAKSDGASGSGSGANGSTAAAADGAASGDGSGSAPAAAKKKFESRVPKTQQKDAGLAKRNKLFGASLLGTLTKARDRLKTDTESERHKKQIELESKIRDKLKVESTAIKQKLKENFESEKLKQQHSLEELWKITSEKLTQLMVCVPPLHPTPLPHAMLLVQELEATEHAESLAKHLKTTNKSVVTLYYRPNTHNSSTESLLKSQSAAALEAIKSNPQSLIVPESEAEKADRLKEEAESFAQLRAASGGGAGGSGSGSGSGSGGGASSAASAAAAAAPAKSDDAKSTAAGGATTTAPAATTTAPTTADESDTHSSSATVLEVVAQTAPKDDDAE